MKRTKVEGIMKLMLSSRIRVTPHFPQPFPGHCAIFKICLSPFVFFTEYFLLQLSAGIPGSQQSSPEAKFSAEALPGECPWGPERRAVTLGQGPGHWPKDGSKLGGFVSDSAMLVSWGSCNKLPQTRWLKATKIYSVTVVEARRPKSRCWQGL